MPTEIEVKFHVSSFGPVEDALRMHATKRLGRSLQTDTFFDTSDRRLFHADCGLRLRVAENLDGAKSHKALLTYKGPQAKGAKTKQRMEIQTALDDPGAIAEIFKHAGLLPSLVLQKRRTAYALGGCEVLLDELPALGLFVEIEGPNEPEIWKVRDLLGLTEESIKTPYSQLAEEYCLKKGLDGKTFTFEKFGV